MARKHHKTHRHPRRHRKVKGAGVGFKGELAPRVSDYGFVNTAAQVDINRGSGNPAAMDVTEMHLQRTGGGAGYGFTGQVLPNRRGIVHSPYETRPKGGRRRRHRGGKTRRRRRGGCSGSAPPASTAAPAAPSM